MIDINEIFSDSDKRIAFWCEDVSDTNDLAIMCDNIINNDVHMVSVPPTKVADVWTYLEKMDVKILTRYDFNPISGKSVDSDMDALSENIVNVCRHGADGVQIFIKSRDFDNFVAALQFVRDDLFFGHDLCIGMDVSDIDISNLGVFFQKLKDIRANTLVLTLNEDMGNRSDFVGRIYAMLQNWDFDGELHFVLGNNFDRIDQVVRLTEILRPELNDKLRFFLDY